MVAPLPNRLWQGYEATLHDLGGAGGKAPPHAGLDFLQQLGFVAEDCSLSDQGTLYFRTRWVLGDQASADELARTALLSHPLVILICQVYHGRGSVRREQLADLLRIEGVAASSDDIGRLLMILSHFKLVTYNKQGGSFVVNLVPSPDPQVQPPTAVFLAPETPFSNLLRFREVLASAEGTPIWLDKHFDHKGFPLIAEMADGKRVTSIAILSGDYNYNPAAVTEFQLLKKEAAIKGVALEWLIASKAALRDVHDRWLVADNWVYNIPPVNSVFGGQAAEIVNVTQNRLAIVSVFETLRKAAQPA